MMNHYGGWGFGLLSGLLSLLLIALVILAIVALVRYLGHQTDRTGLFGGPRGTTRAQEILAERFARGEIDEDEYQRRRDHLRGGQTER
jgi:putative membrane protein